MYRPLSDSQKRGIVDNFNLVYYEVGIPGGNKQKTFIALERKNAKNTRPINLFSMEFQAERASRTYRVKHLEECLPKNVKNLMAVRMFLLDYAIKDLVRSLIADDYSVLFIYSPIEHITEVFMDNKFQIRKRVRKSGDVVYLGYRKI